jgi:manganese oxidase
VRFVSAMSVVLIGCGNACAATTEQLWIERMAAQNGPHFEFQGVHREGSQRVWSYRMSIVDTEHELPAGVRFKVWAFGGTIPGPTLVVREGDVMRLRVANDTSTPHTVHSHGLFVPHRMDGVPHDHGIHGQVPATDDLPGPIQPGETFTYEYIARPAGTHWYHCHVNTNEHLSRGMAGALIVLPRRADPAVNCDEVVLLQEWDSRYARGGAIGSPREYTQADYFTMNGRAFPETPTVRMRMGDVCRLRLINAGMQFHSMHLHGQSFLVTHKDGAALKEPIEMDTVPIGPGERVDLIVQANNPGEWPFHCHNASHQTNAGRYPGGMIMHVQMGPDPAGRAGYDPSVVDLEKVRQQWQEAARIRAR